MVILNEAKIFEALEEFRKHKDYNNLKTAIVALVRESESNTVD